VTTEIEKLERRWQENPLGLTFAPLAEAYRKAGEIGKALELLDTGLAQHPGYVPAHIVRGRCHVDGGERALAELDFLCVAELDPENVIALQGLADLAESEGRLSDAIRRLEALLEVDRNNEEARGQLDRLRDEVLVAPLSAPELRIRNDSEALHPAEEPLSGILILDIESGLPQAPSEPPAEPAPLWQPVAEGLLTSGTETETETETEMETEAEPGAEPSLEPEAPAAPEPVMGEPSGVEPEPEPEPELVVTETMAEIFLRQGHRELALAVYSQLLQREPDNQRIVAAVGELTGSLGPAPTPEPVPTASEPPRRYDARGTGGRPVGEFLSALLSAARPQPPAPAVHPPAFEAPVAAPQSQSRPAEPSFDEFFAPPGARTSEESPPSNPGLAENFRAEDSEDLEQFNAWLRGLKG